MHELDRVFDGDDVLRVLVLLILSIIAASVVDLPEPGGPVTSTRPLVEVGQRGDRVGEFSFSSVMISSGMIRKTAPAPFS